MSQERITITIDKDLLNRVDGTIDKTSIRSRSHAIEHLLLKAMGVNIINTAVVLLGGDSIATNYKNALTTIDDLKLLGVSKLFIVYGDYGEPYLKYFSQISSVEVNTHNTELGSGGGINEIIDQLPNEFYIIECGKKSKFNWEKISNYYSLYCPTLCGDIDSSGLGAFIGNRQIKNYLSNEFSIFSQKIVQAINDNNQLIIIQQL